jgi:hypothetical protein
MIGYFIEVSDTDKSWVEKHYIQADDKSVVRRAKNLIGWNGVRCNRYDRGDVIELKPRHQDVIARIHRES